MKKRRRKKKIVFKHRKVSIRLEKGKSKLMINEYEVRGKKRRRHRANKKTRHPAKNRRKRRHKSIFSIFRKHHKKYRNLKPITPFETPAKNKKDKPKQIFYRKPDDKLTTDIDDMLQIVSEKKRIKADELARKLHVSEQKVEEWAGILEQQGIVGIHYPPFGKPEIRIGTEKAEE